MSMLNRGHMQALVALIVTGCSVDALFEINQDSLNNEFGTCDPTAGDNCRCQTSEDCPSGECNVAECDENGICLLSPRQGKCKNQSGVCDSKGTCVECIQNDQCLDGETCVFSKCIVLKNDGEPCMHKEECINQCWDGVCCDTECSGTCKSCIIPPFIGTCTAVAFGNHDDSCIDTTYGCTQNDMMTLVCIKGGLKGSKCTTDSNCISEACEWSGTKRFCKQRIGPCTLDSQCASNNCENNYCAL
jgi:hypothetical protein